MQYTCTHTDELMNVHQREKKQKTETNFRKLEKREKKERKKKEEMVDAPRQ